MLHESGNLTLITKATKDFETDNLFLIQRQTKQWYDTIVVDDIDNLYNDTYFSFFLKKSLQKEVKKSLSGHFKNTGDKEKKYFVKICCSNIIG